MQKTILFGLFAILACVGGQRITTIQLDGVQYFVSRMNPYSPELNYFLSYQYCRSLGLQLASFETKEKVESMTQYLQNAGYSKYDFWTSGNRLGTGMFLWMSTGLPFNATFDYFENAIEGAGVSSLATPLVDANSNTAPQRTARDSSSGLEKGCVILKAPALKWAAEDCSAVKDFICEQTRCYYYNYGSIPVSSAQGRPITTSSIPDVTTPSTSSYNEQATTLTPAPTHIAANTTPLPMMLATQASIVKSGSAKPAPAPAPAITASVRAATAPIAIVLKSNVDAVAERENVADELPEHQDDDDDMNVENVESAEEMEQEQAAAALIAAGDQSEQDSDTDEHTDEHTDDDNSDNNDEIVAAVVPDVSVAAAAPAVAVSVEQRLKQITAEIEKHNSPTSGAVIVDNDDNAGHQSFFSLADLLKTLRPNDKKIPQIDSDYSNTMRVLGENSSSNDDGRKMKDTVSGGGGVVTADVHSAPLNRALF